MLVEIGAALLQRGKSDHASMVARSIIALEGTTGIQFEIPSVTSEYSFSTTIYIREIIITKESLRAFAALVLQLRAQK